MNESLPKGKIRRQTQSSCLDFGIMTWANITFHSMDTTTISDAEGKIIYNVLFQDWHIRYNTWAAITCVLHGLDLLDGVKGTVESLRSPVSVLPVRNWNSWILAENKTWKLGLADLAFWLCWRLWRQNVVACLTLIATILWQNDKQLGSW